MTLESVYDDWKNLTLSAGGTNFLDKASSMQCLVLLCIVTRSCTRLSCPIKIENAINCVEAVASKQDSGWLLEITPMCSEYTGFLTVDFEQFFSADR